MSWTSLGSSTSAARRSRATSSAGETSDLKSLYGAVERITHARLYAEGQSIRFKIQVRESRTIGRQASGLNGEVQSISDVFRRKLLPRLCEVGFHSLADTPAPVRPCYGWLAGWRRGRRAGAAAAFGFVLTLAFFFTARLGAAFWPSARRLRIDGLKSSA